MTEMWQPPNAERFPGIVPGREGPIDERIERDLARLMGNTRHEIIWMYRHGLIEMQWNDKTKTTMFKMKPEIAKMVREAFDR